MKVSVTLPVAVLLLAFTIDSSLLGQRRDSSEDSCRAFVQSFYDWYAPIADARANPGKGSGPSFHLAIRAKGQAFTGVLVQLLREDYEAQSKAKEIVGLDYDPFLFSQDPCERYIAEKVTLALGATSSRFTVFAAGGKARRRTLCQN